MNYFHDLLFSPLIVSPPRYLTFTSTAAEPDKHSDHRIISSDPLGNPDNQVGLALPNDDALSGGSFRSPHFLEPNVHSDLDSRRLRSIFPYPFSRSKNRTYSFRWTPWDHWFYVKTTPIPPPKTTTSTSSQEVAYPSWIASFQAFAMHLWSPIKAFFAWFHKTISGPTKAVLWKIYEAGRDYCGGFCYTVEFIVAWRPMFLYILWLLPTAFLWLFLVHFWNNYCFAFGKAMGQLFLFAAGKRDWADVRRATGEKIFRPRWTGPGGHTPFSHDFITTDIKGRGQNQLPKDLLISVTINGYEEIARLRHSGLKTSKPSARGFTAKCDSTVAFSSKKLRDRLETSGFKIHLCAVALCPLAAANPLNAVHATKYASVPREIELEVKDLSQLDPFFRMLNMCTCCFGSVLYWFCRKSTYGCRAAFRCCRLYCCYSKRQVDPEDSQSEVEEGDQCQAESVALKFPSFTQSLVCTPCLSPSVGEPQSLLDIDEPVSNLTELTREGGSFVFRCCLAHCNEYQMSKTKRGCATQGCNRAGALVDGIRLCPTHTSEALIRRYDSQKPDDRDKPGSTDTLNDHTRVVDLIRKAMDQLDKTSGLTTKNTPNDIPGKDIDPRDPPARKSSWSKTLPKRHKNRAPPLATELANEENEAPPLMDLPQIQPRDDSLLAEYLAPISEGAPEYDALIS